jgi:anti-sigma B factor antagonist
LALSALPREALFPFEVRLHQRGDTTLLHVSGEFDVDCSNEFRGVLATMPGAARELLVDLRETTFIDSTGIALLLEAWRSAEQSKLPFSLIVAGGQVAETLRLAGLDRFIRTISDGDASSLDGSGPDGARPA